MPPCQLRRAVAQAAHEPMQARKRQRRILADGDVGQRVEPRAPLRRIGRRDRLLANARRARMPFSRRVTRKQAAVMHAIEQVRRGVGRAAPVVAHDAVREVRVDVARMHFAALADECEHRRARARRDGLQPRARDARMHQRVDADAARSRS